MTTSAILLNGFQEHLTLLGKSHATIKAYTRDVRGLLTYCQELNLPVLEIAQADLESYLDCLINRDHKKPSSIRRHILGNKAFFKYLVETDQFSYSPAEGILIPPREEPPLASISTKSIETILNQLKQNTPAIKAQRDSLIFGLLAYEGIKASELISLKWKDVLVHDALTSILIRGSRKRILVLTKITMNLLNSYHSLIRFDMPQLYTPEHQVFVGFKGNHKLSLLPSLTRHGLKFLLYEIGEKFSLDHINCEILRNHAISYHSQHGKSAEEIQEMLGLRRPGKIIRKVQAN